MHPVYVMLVYNGVMKEGGGEGLAEDIKGDRLQRVSSDEAMDL